MAERFNAAVLKTVEPKGSGGSNPSLSAKKLRYPELFLFYDNLIQSKIVRLAVKTH
jgi:hypothetical protein